MQMGPRTAAGIPHMSDSVAPSDRRTGTDNCLGEMTIESGDAVSMIDSDHLPHILLVGNLDYDTVCRRLDDSPMFRCDIDPFVKFSLTAERGGPPSEFGRHPAHDGPYGRGRRQEGFFLFQ